MTRATGGTAVCMGCGSEFTMSAVPGAFRPSHCLCGGRLHFLQPPAPFPDLAIELLWALGLAIAAAVIYFGYLTWQ